jgi:hypothetical protein
MLMAYGNEPAGTNQAAWLARWVGAGKLLVCSADLERDLDKRPAARQLCASLLHYMAGKDFQPKPDNPPSGQKARVGRRAD